MKRIVGSLILCCLCIFGFAQSGFFVKNTHIEQWYIEDEAKETEVKKALKVHAFKEVSKGRVSIEEALPLFHFIDINNDGVWELLFHGKIFNVPHVFIFSKKNDEYTALIGERGSVSSANLPTGDNGLELAIWKEGCCGDFTDSYTQYTSVFSSDEIHFERVAKSLLFRRTSFPSKRYERPVAFKTNAVTHLRSESVVDNEKQIGGKEKWTGNTIAVYPTNAQGTIYAEAKDANNETWYFVRMNNEFGVSITENRFIANHVTAEDIKGCFSYGWIQGKDIDSD